MDILKVSSHNWNCVICSEVMDGDKNGLVAVSKRCLHIFHEACIKRWINEGAHTCPVCKLDNFHIQEVTLNQEYPKQYHKWKEDPNHYSYEQAFNEEYPHSDSTSNSSHENLKYESVLLPNELRGVGRREKLTQSEAFAYMKETKDKLKENINGKRDDVERFALNAFQAQDVALDNLKEEYSSLKEGYSSLKEEYSFEFKKIAHQKLVDFYYDKIRSLYNKARYNIAELKRASWGNQTVITQLLDFTGEVVRYHERFRVAGKIHELYPGSPSMEESKDLLRQVDLELNALVERQPQAVRNILMDPVQINNAPVLDLNSQQGRTRRIIKIAIFAFALFALYKVARSQTVSNFFHKHWKQDLKRS